MLNSKEDAMLVVNSFLSGDYEYGHGSLMVESECGSFVWCAMAVIADTLLDSYWVRRDFKTDRSWGMPSGEDPYPWGMAIRTNQLKSMGITEFEQREIINDSDDRGVDAWKSLVDRIRTEWSITDKDLIGAHNVHETN